MTRYVIAFEVAGLLLTAALVGAIAIAHREEIEPKPGRGSRRTLAAGAGAASGNGQESVAQVNGVKTDVRLERPRGESAKYRRGTSG